MVANETRTIGNRYNRQELIDGWDQNKIRKTSIALVGSGPLANFTAASLVSLGVGSLEIYDNERTFSQEEGEFLLSLAGKKESKVEALEEILQRVNPLVKVTGVPTKIYPLPLAELLHASDIIIEVSNDSLSKKTAYEFAKKKKIPLILAAANATKAELAIKLPGKRETKTHFFENYDGKTQGAIPSEIFGGIIADEMRKIVMPFTKKEKPVQELSYSVVSAQRFHGEEGPISEVSLEDKCALIVGAGALGNFVGLGLALQGVGKIDILDFDNVETTNLNRQLLYYDAVGKAKAIALKEKLKAINPKIKVKGIVNKLDEEYESYFQSKETRPDIILDCVDNFGTRSIINYFAVKYGIPLVSGGTSPSSGQIVVYEPGKSSCLDCKLNVDKALAKERSVHSCVQVSQPSVIMTNEIIGGLMVAEARTVLAPQQYGNSIRKMLIYNSASDPRAGLAGGDAPCNCKRGPFDSWMKEVMKKHG